MAEMRVYIANLGKYNEGELVGAWFTPPINFDEVKERIGLSEEYEEYAIHDYELPFTIGEYCSIEEINRLCAVVERVTELVPESDLRDVVSGLGFTDVEDLEDHIDDIHHYECGSIEELVDERIGEGSFGEIPDALMSYIDTAAIARDLKVENFYVVTSNGLYEYMG